MLRRAVNDPRRRALGGRLGLHDLPLVAIRSAPAIARLACICTTRLGELHFRFALHHLLFDFRDREDRQPLPFLDVRADIDGLPI